MISTIQSDDLMYPAAGDHFSPATRYPECPFGQVSQRPNHVYDSVRRLLQQAGLDAANFGTAAWNPLGGYLRRGSRIFVLCNFVYHRRPGESERDFHGKCTHASVLRALIDYILIAIGPSGSVSFGNAPLQSCDWQRVLRDTGALHLLEFYQRERLHVYPCDLRAFVIEKSVSGISKPVRSSGDKDTTYVSLDTTSLLNALYQDGAAPRFRVSDYNPDRTEAFHARNFHLYAINSNILQADAVISVPKMKTHEKVGVTLTVNGFVGCVSQKVCLAHHRAGPPHDSGDEYARQSRTLKILSVYHDYVCRGAYPRCLRPVLQVADTNLRRMVRRVMHRTQAGAWAGNDTAWRMAVDLEYIVTYVDRNGRICDSPQRRHLALIDGVVGGEGNGPLSPEGAAAGVLVFGDDVRAVDAAGCRLMGYPPDKLPIVCRTIRDRTGSPPHDGVCFLNGKAVALDDLPMALGRAFAPPVGWRGVLP